MNLFNKYIPLDGFTSLVTPPAMEMKLINFGMIRLQSGQTYQTGTEDKEVVLVILSGKCNILSGDIKWEGVGERKSVFEGKPYAAYIPSGSEFSITGAGSVEIAVCMAPVKFGKRHLLITAEDVNVLSRGEGNCYRDVYEITNLGEESQSLMVGETISGAGKWCSWPPHKHELEEIYYYKMDHPQGYGLQQIYTDDKQLNERIIIEDNTLVTIPKGYHPLVVAPPYRVWFLYVIARSGNGPLEAFTDPVHSS